MTTEINRYLAKVFLVGILLTSQIQASGRAVIEVRDEPDAQVMWFRPNAMLFTDRNYRLAECPAGLEGERFLRSSIDSTRFDVVQDGRLIALTPHSIPGAASQTETLEAQGFVQTEQDLFQLFGSNTIDRVLVYQKQVAAGESYEFGKWSWCWGSKTLDPRETALGQPRTSLITCTLPTSRTRAFCSWISRKTIAPDTEASR